MSSMMDDINKYADIWDKALAKGIFDGAPKPPAPIEPEASADFFGQMKTGEYDIDSPLNEGEAKYWKDVFVTYNKIPMVTKVNPDLNAYVTQKALDGLFKVIADEELKIRTDPAARLTDILKKVFGH